MIDLQDFVEDGVARLGNSLFPTHVSVSSMGTSACRFLMIADPAGGWVAGAWKANPSGGDPMVIILQRVEKIVTYTPRMIQLELDDGTTVAITPDKGCGCGGSRLRMFNPFGEGVTLAQVKVPVTE